DNEILLKVKSAAICGTDIRMINNGYSGITEESPRILGHELSGVIEQLGKNIKKYEVGMRVAVAPNMGCGVCDWCTSGNTHMCADYHALGINLDGAFAEYVVIPEEACRQGNVVELKENVSFDEAALNEPLSCVYNGFLKCDIKPGDNVLIIGTGPIGIMHAKLAKMAGAARVMINDISNERLEVCRKIDSSFIILQAGNLKEKVMELTGGKGLDVCITACPSPQAQADALEMMAVNGRVNFFGGLPAGKEIVSINTNLVHYKQLILTGSARASLSHFRKTLDFISSGIINVKDLVSERFTLDKIHDGVQRATRAEGLKNIIYFD
ncbi:MAG: alcohol dehydrogenase catalytic domain-containing protein, partial [Ruminiclostridium sp.]